MNLEIREPKRYTYCTWCDQKAVKYIVVESVRGGLICLSFCDKHYERFKEAL